jgi:PKD repeat protein
VIEPPPPPAPVADFDADTTSGTAPLTVQFSDLSTNDPTAWSWDFGDDGTSSVANPSHTYTAAGCYTVSLNVSSEAGEDGETKIGYITVIEPPPPPTPVADFDADTTSGTAPLTVQFSDLSTNDPTAWSWDFGDDGISSEANPSHTYAAPGSYTVSLSVSSEAGEDGETKIGYITVAPALTQPDAQFLADPTAGTAPLTVSFTDQSTNYPTTWSWDFGDGWYSAARNPSHTYDTPGTYTVRLTAINAAGSGVEVRADCIQVIAPGSPPVADFEGDPLEGVAPLTVDFTDGSTPPPTAWLWAFGDGATSSERNPGHTYDSPGTYTVTLHVSNADGEGTRIRVAYVHVSAPPITPQADFAGTPTNGAAPLAVDFTDLSDNGPTAWSWDFGDGATATAQNPSHIYAAPGAFTVVLIARGAGGETVATKTDYVTVTAPRSETLALTLTPPSPVDLGNGITYVVPSEGHVRLELFSLEGRCLALLDEGSRSAGAHQVPFRFAAYSAGAAFLRLNWMGEVLTRRLILMK